MTKNTLIKAAILGMLAVLGGAFGAHALKEVLTPSQLASYQTAVHYQMTHAIVLIGLFLLGKKYEIKHFKQAAQFIFFGVILFSGSIYVLTLKNLMDLDYLKFIGPITPIGGLLIVVGWLLVLLGGLKIKQ